MKLTSKGGNRKRSECTRCYATRSQKRGWFSKQKKPYKEVVLFLVLLFSNHSIKAISNHLEWNRNTISKYASLVSDACVVYNERDFESQKGTWGSGHGRRVRVVVWDETMVGARRKYNMGRAWHNKTWISGGVEIEKKKGRSIFGGLQ